ncbi:nuclear transport factor 2 family protein [Novosphingobium soli]|uniref:Nuclear transport factor 2 family protein n=1 Tax=Novosphingobium soli TaxID=574956 RepID=A0ABV6D175_9SPHN
MTLDELLAREAIRDLMARYTTAGDRLRVDDFVACFTQDAVIESERVPPDRLFRYEGRPAIRAWQERWRRGEGGTHGATFVRHHLSTSRIELEGADGARAWTYWVAWTDIGPDHAGTYLDTLRRAEGTWLIAHRRVRLDWEAPNSLFRSAVANSGRGAEPGH